MKTTIIIKFLDGTSKEIEHGDYLSILADTFTVKIFDSHLRETNFYCKHDIKSITKIVVKDNLLLIRDVKTLVAIHYKNLEIKRFKYDGFVEVNIFSNSVTINDLNYLDRFIDDRCKIGFVEEVISVNGTIKKHNYLKV